jgi:hydroxymethylpyrimidine/phosphomethylpyrimidine kinase
VLGRDEGKRDGGEASGKMIARALTIAGSDSSGGAGVQADLKTFTVLRAYGMTAITAVTAQNTQGVIAVEVLPARLVEAQIQAVVTDIGVDAVKTGMLATAEIISAVAACVRKHGLQPLVVDPVMRAQSGAQLLAPQACEVLREELLPLATLVTPNVPEAEALVGFRIESRADMERAAERIVAHGAGACLIKGGHLLGPQAEDVLFDGSQMRVFASPRYPTPHTHGTGCQLSAAITAALAHGVSLEEAVARAKSFIAVAIAEGLALGKGSGPANPLAWLDR